MPKPAAATRPLALTKSRRNEVLDRLLGHWRHRMPAEYAHLADAHLFEAADRIGSFIAEAMKGAHQ